MPSYTTQDIKALATHPFKEAISLMIAQHFDHSIAKNFYGILEAEKYNKSAPNVLKQLRDEKYVLEIYYNNPNGMSVYICDIFSGWSKAMCEAHLLKMITDKYISGQIGTDWIEKGGKLSAGIKTGKHATLLDKNGEPIY